jgi:hypothetical protein
MAVIKPGPETGHEIMSTRCCGRSPSGPPDDPVGKERIALDTSVSVTRIALYCAESGGLDLALGRIYLFIYYCHMVLNSQGLETLIKETYLEMVTMGTHKFGTFLIGTPH